MGFDDAVLKEKRFPTSEDLDKVSKEVPICIVHISGHFCVMNSKGLEMKKKNASTKDPVGGIIRRMTGTKEPNGVLEELAAIPVYFTIVNPSDPNLVDYYLDKAQPISPIKSAIIKGLHVTSHTDAPVAFPNLMMILWTTVNRISRSGTIIGASERLTPYEALKCITI